MSTRTRSSHQTKTDILIGAMSVCLYVVLGITFFLCLSINNVFLRIINRTLATTLLTFTAMTVAMHAVYGGFDVGRKKNKPVISAMIGSTVITDLVTYLQLEIMNVNESYNDRLMLFGPDLFCLLLCMLLQVLVIVLFVRVGNQIYFYFNPPRSCLVILGSPSQETDMREKLGRYYLQWRVDDVVLYNVPDLNRRIRKADVVFLGNVPEGAKFALLKICYDDRKDVMCKAELEDIMLCNARPAIVDDAAFLAMEYNKITVFQRIVKRLGDIIISVLALILLSPVLLIISALIRSEDGGPAIFSQPRVTADGRTFIIRKFRTMAPNSSKNDIQVSVAEDDPRITKIGAFLRRYRLDELPQFYNILVGDMSLVGPRPEMMANVARYKNKLPAFVYREKMKAGLTGYAQIEGRYNTSAEDKLMLDMMYIESFSIWLDVKLLLRTFTVLLKPDSTQGFRKRAPPPAALRKDPGRISQKFSTQARTVIRQDDSSRGYVGQAPVQGARPREYGSPAPAQGAAAQAMPPHGTQPRDYGSRVPVPGSPGQAGPPQNARGPAYSAPAPAQNAPAREIPPQNARGPAYGAPAPAQNAQAREIPPQGAQPRGHRSSGSPDTSGQTKPNNVPVRGYRGPTAAGQPAQPQNGQVRGYQWNPVRSNKQTGIGGKKK